MLDAAALTVLKLLAAFFRALPLDWALAAGAFIGKTAYFFRRGKGIAYLNLKAAFEGVYTLAEIKLIARRSCENLGRNAVEVLRFPLMDDRFFHKHSAIQGYPRVADALAKGKGMIYCTAHFGNWEFLLARSCYTGLPLKALFRRQHLRKVNEYINELRTWHGCELIGRGSQVKDFIRALKEGSAVGIAGDQIAKQGLPVRFFGRKTLAAPGLIEIGRRTGAPVLPAFDVRENGNFHRIHVTPPLISGSEQSLDVQEELQKYYDTLETFVRRYPDQWLWDHKRWKISFTKTVLVLTDGKAGHESQSKAMSEFFGEVQRDQPEYEFNFRTVRAEYRSPWHRKALTALTPLLLPWIRGRVELLRFFLTEQSYAALAPVYADFVISCGSSLLALNRLLSRENKAKSIVMMKPTFPFQKARFDLVVAPRHDAPVPAPNVVYTEIAMSPASGPLLKREGEKLAHRLGLNGKRILSVFVGGDTRHYSMLTEKVREALDRILQMAKDSNAEILLTTSRRTREELSELIKRKLSAEKCCRLLVIANEENIENVTWGMMSVSDTLFVTEDSISMISEAVGSGKKVAVLEVGAGNLPAKHARFKQNLESKNLIKILAPSEISAQSLNPENGRAAGPEAVLHSHEEIKKKLLSLL